MRLLPLMTLLGCLTLTEAFKNRTALMNLRRELLKEADPFLPPPHQGDSVAVNLTIRTKSIVDVDTAEEAMTIVMSIKIEWFDSSLAWSPQDHDGIDHVVVSSKEVWTPKLIVSNSLNFIGPIIRDNEVGIDPDGSMLVSIVDVFRVKSKLDMTHYPYDDQSCKVEFEVLKGFKLSLSVKLRTKKMDDGEWTFLGHNATIASSFSYWSLTYNVFIRRISNFYSLQVVFPMTLMSVLHALVFLVPAESGEKCSYLMAVFMSHFIFQNLIYTSLPRSSVSHLSLFSVAILVQGVVAILATVLSLHRHHKVKAASSSLAAGPDFHQGQGHGEAWVKDSVKVRPEEGGEGQGERGIQGKWLVTRMCLHWSDYVLCVAFLATSIVTPFFVFLPRSE